MDVMDEDHNVVRAENNSVQIVVFSLLVSIVLHAKDRSEEGNCGTEETVEEPNKVRLEVEGVLLLELLVDVRYHLLVLVAFNVVRDWSFKY